MVSSVYDVVYWFFKYIKKMFYRIIAMWNDIKSRLRYNCKMKKASWLPNIYKVLHNVNNGTNANGQESNIALMHAWIQVTITITFQL